MTFVSTHLDDRPFRRHALLGLPVRSGNVSDGASVNADEGANAYASDDGRASTRVRARRGTACQSLQEQVVVVRVHDVVDIRSGVLEEHGRNVDRKGTVAVVAVSRVGVDGPAQPPIRVLSAGPSLRLIG